MTMQCERTRSIIQAREFLIELSQNTNLPEATRTAAKALAVTDGDTGRWQTRVASH
ncbi:BPSL0761 family protein [Vreelandella neptunia]|uniref:BPSL0761 family protein n=1 Tax=Vreelandella neptunia TaxID=115551 RepID=UPI003CC9D379